MDDLVRIFSYNESLFVDTYNNLNAVLLRDTINNGISRNNSTYLEKERNMLNNYIHNMRMIILFFSGAEHQMKLK